MKITCFNCKEKYPEDDLHYTSITGKPICEGCLQSSEQYQTTLIYIPSKKEQIDGQTPVKYQFDEDNGVQFYGHQFEEIDVLEDLPTPIKALVWKKTDAWRGYQDWVLEKGFEELSDGWITGWPDETTQRKVELSDIFESTTKQGVKPPCSLWWIFGITSNVFSQSSALIIKTKDRKEALEFLNVTSEELDSLFS